MSSGKTVIVKKVVFGILPHAISVDGAEYGICITRGILDLIKSRKINVGLIEKSLIRHAYGDWGEVSQEDKEENDRCPDEALSAYVFEGGLKIWIVTEADKFIVLLPEEN